MRVLFTTQPGTGMFRPLVPFAGALANAGHEVAFACSPSFRPQVEAVGFETFPAGIDWVAAELTKAFPDAPPPGPARGAWVPAFWRLVTARASVPDLLAIAQRWAPDLFVRESTEFGACLAAELLARPHAVAGALWFRSELPFAEPHDQARRAVGLPADPQVTSPYRYLALATMPPAWVAPDEAVPPTTHFIGPRPFEGIDDTTEAPWPDRQDGRPVVHATLGTTEANRSPGLYEAIIGGLRDEPVALIVAIGDQRDPADFGPQPPNVRIERYVSHAALLPRCDLVVTHGGYGTIMACLSLGVPMVVVPIQGDQPRNARRCADLGVGKVVGPDERTREAIRAAAQAVLRDPSYRANAERVRDEIAGLRGPARAVDLLERLVATGAPVLAAAGL